LYVPRAEGERMKRGQAITLLKDSCLKERIVKPVFVSIDHSDPNDYKLKIKGDYDIESIEQFVQKRNFSVKEDKDKGFLVIS
jgi:hypothetical protein